MVRLHTNLCNKATRYTNLEQCAWNPGVREFRGELDSNFEVSPVVAFFKNTNDLRYLFSELKRLSHKDGSIRTFSSLRELHQTVGVGLKDALESLAAYEADFSCKFKREVINWIALGASNFKSLHAKTCELVKVHGALHAMELNLLYPDFDVHRVKRPSLEQVQKDWRVLLRGKAHRDLSQQLAGYIWRLGYSDEGLMVQLVLFTRPDKVAKPGELREQLGQRWARDVVADSLGRYSTGEIGRKNIILHPVRLLESNDPDLQNKVDELVCGLTFQDFFLRLKPNQPQESGESENRKKQIRPRMFAFVGLPQEKTREVARLQNAKARAIKV